MKTVHCFLFLLFSQIMAPAGLAALQAEFPAEEQDGICMLDPSRAIVRDEQWNYLAQRYFLASVEVMKDPEQFERVRREVSVEIAKMRRQYGAACVLDIR